MTQCFSLTLVFWAEPSNSIFSSFCLSSTPHSLALLWSTWFSFFAFYFHLHTVQQFSPCVLICSIISSHPPSLIGFYDLAFVAYATSSSSSSSSCTVMSPSSPPTFPPFYIWHRHLHLGPPPPAWQGTDLMHNHVLADVDRSCVDSPGRRSSVSRPELTSDLSEDSDYDSIWTTHSYRMGSVPRKSCISHQN